MSCLDCMTFIQEIQYCDRPAILNERKCTEFWRQKLAIVELNSVFHKGYIPKAKRKAKKLCMDKTTLDSLFDCHEF